MRIAWTALSYAHLEMRGTSRPCSHIDSYSIFLQWTVGQYRLKASRGHTTQSQQNNILKLDAIGTEVVSGPSLRCLLCLDRW